MSWILSFVLFAFGVYIVYNTISMVLFGVPHSLSMTYYLFKEQGFKLRYLFPALIVTMVVCLMPGWIEISEGSTYQFTAFLSAAGLAFVGAAPAFRDCKIENKVHMVSAACAAVFALLWCCVVCYQIAWIIVPLSLIVVWATAFITKTHKTAATYWWEMVAFLATFVTIITECIILMQIN